MWELDCEESWAPKNWWFWTVVLEKTLESPSDCKEIQPVHSKGDQSWVFIGRTSAEAETPILWPPHAELTHWKRRWCWEGLGAGGEGDDRGWDGWMASLTRWTWVWMNPGDGDGQGGLACCNSWSCRVRHDWGTELNWTEHIQGVHRSAYCQITLLILLLFAQPTVSCPCVDLVNTTHSSGPLQMASLQCSISYKLCSCVAWPLMSIWIRAV